MKGSLSVTEQMNNLNKTLIEQSNFINEVAKMRELQKIGHDINSRIEAEKIVDKYLETCGGNL